MSEQPEDLRAALINHPKAMISTDENYPTVIQIPLDDLLRLCEAAALAALPESIILTPWKNTEDMPAHQRQLGRNETIATAQANIHSRFGGTSE